MMQQSVTGGAHRIDIQQLRAFAVIAVIVNHLAGGIFTGGYLGVDAFFVVSGYVITRSIANQPDAHQSRARFFVEFWVRRIYRLWPALFVVVSATSAIVWLLGVATPSMMLTGVTALVSLSNVRLYLGLQDYFALSTNNDWFMHTWSLSVEEQFYLIVSVLFGAIGLHRVGARSSRSGRTIAVGLVVTVVLGAASLALADLPVINEVGRFYLPVTRFYQLAAGVVIALAERTRGAHTTRVVESRDVLRRTTSVIACAVLVAAMSVEVFTPRWSSLIVTALVTVTLVVAPASIRRTGYVSSQLLTRIGDRSYALYLVHWPIQLTTDLLIEESAAQIAASIAATVIFAEALHHLVENRYRSSYRSHSLTRSLTIAAAALVAVVFANAAFFNQLDRRAQNAVAPDESDRCAFAWAVGDGARAASLTSRIWVLGDSHSEAIEPALARALSGDCVVVARLGPFVRHQVIGTVDNVRRAIRVSLGKPDDLIAWITSAVPAPSALIVTHYLTAYMSDPATAPLSSDLVATEWLDSSGEAISRERFIERFGENLQLVADALDGVGAKLVVTSPPPDFNWLTTPLKGVNCDSGVVRPRVCITYTTEATISLVDHRSRRHDVDRLLGEMTRSLPNVHHIDLSEPFCDAVMCSNFNDGVPLYIDDDHLGFQGRRLVEPLIRQRVGELVAQLPRPGKFIRCVANTTVYNCDYVRVDESGFAEADSIDFVEITPSFPAVDSQTHTDNFGDNYCVRLFDNGDGVFAPGDCRP